MLIKLPPYQLFLTKTHVTAHRAAVPTADNATQIPLRIPWSGPGTSAENPWYENLTRLAIVNTSLFGPPDMDRNILEFGIQISLQLAGNIRLDPATLLLDKRILHKLVQFLANFFVRIRPFVLADIRFD